MFGKKADERSDGEQPITGGGVAAVPPMLERFLGEGVKTDFSSGFLTAACAGNNQLEDGKGLTRTGAINDNDESPKPANEVPELTPSEAESLMNETRIGKSSRRQLRVYKKLLRKGRISGRSKHFEHMDNFYKVAVLRFHPILLCIVQSEERMHGRGDI